MAADGEQKQPEDRVVAILDHLAELYKPEGVGIWIFAAHRLLDGRRAIDLLRAGDYDDVERALPPLGMVAT